MCPGGSRQDKELWSGFTHLRVQEGLFKGSPDLLLDFMLLLALVEVYPAAQPGVVFQNGEGREGLFQELAPHQGTPLREGLGKGTDS